MRSEPAYAALLESTDRPTSDAEQHLLQTESGFPYRMAMGELIFAMVIIRADLSFSITKLSQYNASQPRQMPLPSRQARCFRLPSRHPHRGSHLLASRTPP